MTDQCGGYREKKVPYQSNEKNVVVIARLFFL